MTKKLLFLILLPLTIFILSIVYPKTASAQQCGQICETVSNPPQISCNFKAMNTCFFTGGVCRCSYAVSCGPVVNNTCMQGGGWMGEAPAFCCGAPPPPPPPPPPGATPAPPPVNGCSGGSSCVTGVSNCGQVGMQGGSGTCTGGLCCTNTTVFNCDWDTGQTGYPSCKFGEGNSCNQSPFCQAPFGSCSGCADGLTGSPCNCPSCAINAPNSININVGQVYDIPNINSPTSNFSPQFILSNSSPTVATSSLPWYGYLRITGVSAGTTVVGITGRWNGRSPRNLCSDSVFVTVTGTPSCTLDITTPSGNISMLEGSTWPVQANVTPQNGGIITSVSFSSSDTGSGTVSPIVDLTGTASGSAFVYDSVFTAVGQGAPRINAIATLSTGQTCTDPTPPTVTVTPPGAWWQVVGGNVTSGGSITSKVPTTIPVSDRYLIKNPLVGYPGVVVYGDSLDSVDFSLDPTTTGEPSTRDWLVSSSITTPKYTYDYALSLLPSNWSFSNVGTSGNLNGATSINGYEYYKADGDFTINQPQNINQKIVLFVGGDLMLNDTIRLLSSTSFFMAIVSGNIIVDPSVSNVASGEPGLQGYFLADGTFRTGTNGTSSDEQLLVAGSVVALTGFNLERDLGASNSTTPGEEFRELPRLQLLFPPSLVRDTVVWEEVAP